MTERSYSRITNNFLFEYAWNTIRREQRVVDTRGNHGQSVYSKTKANEIRDKVKSAGRRSETVSREEAERRIGRFRCRAAILSSSTRLTPSTARRPPLPLIYN